MLAGLYRPKGNVYGVKVFLFGCQGFQQQGNKFQAMAWFVSTGASVLINVLVPTSTFSQEQYIHTMNPQTRVSHNEPTGVCFVYICEVETVK